MNEMYPYGLPKVETLESGMRRITNVWNENEDRGCSDWKPIPHRLEPRCAQCLAWDDEKGCEFKVKSMCDCPMKICCMCENLGGSALVGGLDKYKEEKMRFAIGEEFGLV